MSERTVPHSICSYTSLLIYITWPTKHICINRKSNIINATTCKTTQDTMIIILDNIHQLYMFHATDSAKRTNYEKMHKQTN